MVKFTTETGVLYLNCLRQCQDLGLALLHPSADLEIHEPLLFILAKKVGETTVPFNPRQYVLFGRFVKIGHLKHIYEDRRRWNFARIECADDWCELMTELNPLHIC